MKLSTAIHGHRMHADYDALAEKTQQNYESLAKRLLSEKKGLGNPHIETLKRSRVVNYLTSEKMKKTPVMASRLRSYLRVVLQFAVDNDWIEENVASGINLKNSTKRSKKIHIWTDEELDTFIETADSMGRPSAGTAVLIAHELGTRPTDTLKLRMGKHYENGVFKFHTSKTNVPITIPATLKLQDRLKSLDLKDGAFLAGSDFSHRSYTEAAFSKLFGKVRGRMKAKRLVFHNLRHTALIKMHRAGLTEFQIASITGHSLRTVRTTIENYLARDGAAATDGIALLEAYRLRKENSINIS